MIAGGEYNFFRTKRGRLFEGNNYRGRAIIRGNLVFIFAVLVAVTIVVALEPYCLFALLSPLASVFQSLEIRSNSSVLQFSGTYVL